MTVYSENPIEIARDFENKGAKFIHLVDFLHFLTYNNIVDGRGSR